MSVTPRIVALSETLAAELAPFEIRFELEAGESGYDMTTVVGVRALVERPDFSTAEWTGWTIEPTSPAPTADAITVTRETTGADFVDAQGRTVFGTYALRFVADFEGDERPLELAYLPVEKLF